MKNPTLKQAKKALQAAWGNAATQGMKFGKLCFELKTKLGNDPVFDMYKEIGIKTSVAEWWVEKYAVSIGFKKLRNEKHPHRGQTDSFEPIRLRALKMLGAGYTALLEEGKDSPRDLLAAKTWAFARLKGKDVEVAFVARANQT
jgi:hypothetical protein